MRLAHTLLCFVCLSVALADSVPSCKTLLEAKAPRPGASDSTAQQIMDCAVQIQADGDVQAAQHAFDLAHEIVTQTGNRALQARALAGAGDTRQALGDLAHAEPMLRESLRIREELQDKAGIADSLGALGRYYITAGDDQKVREYFGRSLKLDEELGNRKGVAIALNNIGISWKPHDALVALDYFQKSLDVFRSLGDERRANVVYNNVGLADYQLGDLQHAVAISREVIATWERIGFGDREGPAENSLGVESLELGDYRTALQCLERALAAFSKQKNTFGIAEISNNLALVYRAQGAYAEAADALEKCIQLCRQLGNTDLESEALANLGEVQFLWGKPSEANKSLHACIELAEKLDAKLKIAFATYNLGRLNLSEGRFKEADLYLKRSLAVEESIHDQLEVGATLVAISDLEYKRGDMPSSREFAQRAVAAGEHTRQMEVQWTAYTALGRAQKALGHPAEAKQAFESAIALLEDLRTRVAGGARERAIFFASKTEPYQERMELAIEAGRIDEAFHYSERARARALLDTIDRHHEPLAKAMTADQRAEERRLRMVLTAASLEMQSAAAPDADLSRRKQDQARLNYQTFQTALYAAHPDLRVARAESPIIDVKAAQALLPSHNAALLEFTVTPRQTWLFVINAAGVRRFTLKISQAALKRRVEVFLAQLSNRDLRVDQAARDLYALLIEPANSALAGTSDWIVSPDGPLWELPFQALEPEQGHFLIERVSFSYAPSFTVLSAEMQAAARRKTSGDTLLAFGDPAGRSPLPDAARQVQAVAAIYPGSRSYTGMDATEERWKREAPPYRILHFAAHAVFDDRSPLYSHITLAEPAPGSSEDGLLEAWEIMQLDLNAQLSVLSACETARGGDVPGEGVIGLTWALFVAGSPSALVSQWKVDAKSSGDLMLEFHRQWRGGSNGIGKAKALQSAQLAMLRKPNSHPFDWAAFILVGDGR